MCDIASTSLALNPAEGASDVIPRMSDVVVAGRIRRCVVDTRVDNDDVAFNACNITTTVTYSSQGNKINNLNNSSSSSHLSDTVILLS